MSYSEKFDGLIYDAKMYIETARAFHSRLEFRSTERQWITDIIQRDLSSAEFCIKKARQLVKEQTK